MKNVDPKNNGAQKSQKLSKTELQKLNLIGHIEQIVEQATGSKLSKEFLKKVQPHTDYIGERLELTAMQSVLISLFINCSDDRRIELKDLAAVVDCTNIALIRLMNDVDVLVAKKYIWSRQNDDNYQFNVPRDFIDAVRKEIPYIPDQFTNLDKDSLFVSIEKALKLRDDGECSFETMMDDLEYIFENNQHLLFCKKIKAWDNEQSCQVILTAFCSLLVNDDDNMIGFHNFIDLLDGKGEQRRNKRNMEQGDHLLMAPDCKMIEPVNEDGFESPEYFKLTRKAKEELLSEYDLKETPSKPPKEFVQHTALVAKELYYNQRETAQIEQLSSLLENDNLKNVQSRLEQSGMRKGFACLFYGAPGTGKTETVYQVARKTQRDIMVVNVAQIKSMWVGESEKNIKALFDRYRAFCQKSALAPILLFNEADAVLGVRQEGAGRAVDKMENSIQNIILQEMESLDGIMIATTNLTANLDKAFERRFLYKIEFSKPSIAAKRAIWCSMIPCLSNEEALELAEKYDFSGGQIENIARKRTVDEIIHGRTSSLDEMHAYCSFELLVKQTAVRKIGY